MAIRNGTGFMHPSRGGTPGGGVNEPGGNWAGEVNSTMLIEATSLPSSSKLRNRGKSFVPTGWKSRSLYDEFRTITSVASLIQISNADFALVFDFEAGQFVHVLFS